MYVESAGAIDESQDCVRRYSLDAKGEIEEANQIPFTCGSTLANQVLLTDKSASSRYL